MDCNPSEGAGDHMDVIHDLAHVQQWNLYVALFPGSPLALMKNKEPGNESMKFRLQYF